MRIDCRERAILEIAPGTLEYESCQLDLGDFNILVDGVLAVCIERKTYADLQSSIVDGRFREQRDRMRCTIGAARMVYVLEGFPDRYDEWDANCVTATFHMQHRDGIRVVRTCDAQDTVKYLGLLVARVAKEPEKYGVVEATGAGGMGGGIDAYQSNLHAAQVCRKKGGNLGSAAVYRLMLSSIPGISERIATNIEAKMGSFFQLMTSLMACATHAERLALLTEIDKVGAGKATLILSCLGFGTA